MEVSLTRDGEGPEFSKVTKRFQDSNVITIGSANDSPPLDTRVYEVEHLDCHKAALVANTITYNVFAHIDDEGNQFMNLETISNRFVNGE